MSGTWPTTPYFKNTTLRASTGVLVSRTNSGRIQVRDTGRHVWTFSAVYPRLTRATFMPVLGFVLSQRGPYGSFQIVPPDLATPRGALGGTPLVQGASQSGNTLSIDGCTPNVGGWLKAGDVFKLAGHSKVYMCTVDVNINGVGAGLIFFEPALVAVPADNEALTVTNVPFTMQLAGNEQEYQTESPAFYRYEIAMEERL